MRHLSNAKPFDRMCRAKARKSIIDFSSMTVRSRYGATGTRSQCRKLLIEGILYGKGNKQRDSWALVDTGSPWNFVSEEILNELDVTPTSEHFQGAIGIHTTRAGRNALYQIDMKMEATERRLTRIHAGSTRVQDFILGLDWLQKENPDIDWAAGTMTPKCGRLFQTSSSRSKAPKADNKPFQLPSAKNAAAGISHSSIPVVPMHGPSNISLPLPSACS